MAKILKKQKVEEIKNCNFSWCNGKCHWIIVNNKTKNIFQYPLKTKEDAIATIQFNKLSGYSLEHKNNK